MHKLFTITTNIQGRALWKKPSETFIKQNLWKISKKKLIFSEVADSNNEFIHRYFQRSLLKA